MPCLVLGDWAGLPFSAYSRDGADVAERELDGLKKGAAGKKKKATLDEVEAARLLLEDAKKAVPTLPALLVGDATPEALVRRMAIQEGRAVIMSPEGDFLHTTKPPDLPTPNRSARPRESGCRRTDGNQRTRAGLVRKLCQRG